MWLQTLINDCPDLLNEQLAPRLGATATDIDWLSPLRADDYREYRDDAFLELLGIQLTRRPLESFWPNRGPQWDGLGKTSQGHQLLVEAKSHVKELVSSSAAKDPCSVAKMRQSLTETKRYISRVSEANADWTVGTYQYANRLAHLYLLHRLNGLDAYLIQVYFLNDEDMKKPDTHVPSTQSEWESVIVYQERLMGIRQRHPLTDRIVHAFIDVNDIRFRI